MEYKLYKGYILGPGEQHPAVGVYEVNIYQRLDAAKDYMPFHTSESEWEATLWIDGQVGYDATSLATQADVDELNKKTIYKYGWYLIDRKANDTEYSFPEYTEAEATEKMRGAVESRYNVFYYNQPGWVATGTYYAPVDLNPSSIDDIKPYVTGFVIT